MSKDKTTAKKFGESIRKRRLELGMSQEELGLKVELDRTYISGIERGVRNPSLINISRIARGLKTSVSKLFDSHT